MILRVFPRRTSYTPEDPLAFVGDPPLWKPDRSMVAAVYVSCTFTWDKPEAERLADAWRQHYDHVVLGGPAYESAGDNSEGMFFYPGMFVKPGVTFTSRGCNNHCPWCAVPSREGACRILPVMPGNIIQDNNLLQCPSRHLNNVFDMLADQHKIVFAGGLDAYEFDDGTAARLISMAPRIDNLFFAYDPGADYDVLLNVSRLLHGHFSREKLRCYVMVAFDGESIMDADTRLRAVYKLGFMPFCQLYRPIDGQVINYGTHWKTLQHQWSRPAAVKAMMKGVKTIWE